MSTWPPLALALLAAACEIATDCPSVSGAPSDFTAGPEERAAYSISGVMLNGCLSGDAVIITGHGPEANRVPTVTWFNDEVRPGLDEQGIGVGIYPLDGTWFSCEIAEEGTIFVETDDWRNVDAIVTTTATRMAVDALAGQAVIVVAGPQCPG